MRRTLVLLALILASDRAAAQQFSLVIDAGPNMKELRDVVGERFTFICKPNLQLNPVYGTDQYTDDSPICTSAVHAGVITKEKGGAVTLVIEEGRGSYPGSSRNGVSSASWNSAYDRHYVFVTGSGGQIDWGTSATKLPADFNTPLDLFCPPGAPAYLITKSVYGSDVYTDTTPICVAAVHAGVITLAGGDVRLTPRGARTAFAAATRNGIISKSYGAWDGSYSVSRVLQPSRSADPLLGTVENPALKIMPTALPPVNNLPELVDSLDNIIGRTLRYGAIASVDSLDNMVGRLGQLPGGPRNEPIVQRVDSLDNIVARIIYPRIARATITNTGTAANPKLSFSLLDASGARIPAQNIETYALPVSWTTSSAACGFAGGSTETGPTAAAKPGCAAAITGTIKRPAGAPASLPATKTATFQLR